MLQTFKKFLWAGLLIAGLQSALAFSLLGPIGNGGDAWQVKDIGYGLASDIGAPKNLGEGYRLNVPTVYYAYDAAFLGYFGLIGSTNIDGAFAILNGLTNVSSYSSDLSEFPLSSEQINYSAQSLGLTDLKSYALGFLVEHSGLASPERYVYTLHNRYQPAGTTCPASTSYTVVQRNFDVITSPLNQIQYSAYVNGTFFTYQIDETCQTTVPPEATTYPYLVDPLSLAYTPVASFIGGGAYVGGILVSFPGLDTGGFYTGLTRDDVAGLRYLLSSNNLVTEATSLYGGNLLLTNSAPTQLLASQPFSLLFQQAAVLDPSSLLALYPGLAILSVTTNYFATVITTNFAPYFTNQSVPPVFSNYPIAALTNGGFYFTNQPGPTAIFYDINNPAPTPTLDLAVFVDYIATNSPAAVLAAYPGLQILSATPRYVYMTNVVYNTYQTNYQWYGITFTVTAAVATNYAWGTNWSYVFGNVYTNHYYSRRPVVNQTVYTTNYQWYGTTYVITNPPVVSYVTHASGDFFIIPTNWFGFEVYGTLPLNNPPYVYSAANVYASGLTSNSITTTYSVYTNYNYMLIPGSAEPVLVLATNYSTNTLTTYQYVFGGILTNSYFANATQIVTVTNVSPAFGSTSNLLTTNVYTVTNLVSQPSGDFFLIPPAWCGYAIVSGGQTNVGYVTNVIAAFNATNIADVGQYYIQTTIQPYTNRTIVVTPQICTQQAAGSALRQGIERVQYVRGSYDSTLGQFFTPITNTYTMVKVVNGQPVTEYYQRVISAPDIVFSATDLDAGPASPLLLNSATRTANIFDQSTILAGLAGPGVINPATQITFNKAGPTYINTSPFFMDGPASQIGMLWASFDGTTNAPVVYPNGTSIADLEAEALFQAFPSTLTAATNGTPYAQTFTATGGQPPYVWAAPGITNAVPGMSFSGATLSGTPSAAGTFSFTLQVTDSLNRVVSLPYTLTVQ